MLHIVRHKHVLDHTDAAPPLAGRVDGPHRHTAVCIVDTGSGIVAYHIYVGREVRD